MIQLTVVDVVKSKNLNNFHFCPPESQNRGQFLQRQDP